MSTTKIAKQLSVQNRALKAEETEERNKRTVLVRRPVNVEIKDSKGIRQAFNKEYPGIIIRNCMITAGGSFKIELDNEEDTEAIKGRWKRELFGGNEGVVAPDALHTSGIVKHVYLDASEEDIDKWIREKTYSFKCGVFKRNDQFHGTIKITFNNREDLMDVLSDRIKILDQRFILEEFKPVPRVIKCNRCQSFGHIARRCRSVTSQCGKCGEGGHESNSCTSSTKKCVHCKDEDHITGDKSCSIMKQKLQEIKNRYQYDF